MLSIVLNCTIISITFDYTKAKPVRFFFFFSVFIFIRLDHYIKQRLGFDGNWGRCMCSKELSIFLIGHTLGAEKIVPT